MLRRDGSLRGSPFPQPLFKYANSTAIGEDEMLDQLLRAPLLRIARRMKLRFDCIQTNQHSGIRLLDGIEHLIHGCRALSYAHFVDGTIGQCFAEAFKSCRALRASFAFGPSGKASR